MATAGFNYAVLHPTIRIAKLDPVTGRGPKWPPRVASKQTEAAMSALGWIRWWGMNDGLTLTIADPQAAITSSDRGNLGQVSTGAHGITLASQSKTPVVQFLDWFTKQASRSVAAVGGTNEVRTLTVAGTATAAGNAIIVLNNEVYTVAIASGDTAAAAATKIRDATNYEPDLVGYTLGGATADVVYTTTTPGARTGQYSATMPAGLTGTFATTTPGVQATSDAGEVLWFDPNGEYGSVQGFTVMVEATTTPGSFHDQAYYYRWIVHRVNQGGNNALRFDDSGANAPTVLNLAGQAEPRRVSALELIDFSTNYVDDQDPYGKATLFRAPLRAA